MLTTAKGLGFQVIFPSPTKRLHYYDIAHKLLSYDRLKFRKGEKCLGMDGVVPLVQKFFSAALGRGVRLAV